MSQERSSYLRYKELCARVDSVFVSDAHQEYDLSLPRDEEVDRVSRLLRDVSRCRRGRENYRDRYVAPEDRDAGHEYQITHLQEVERDLEEVLHTLYTTPVTKEESFAVEEPAEPEVEASLPEPSQVETNECREAKATRQLLCPRRVLDDESIDEGSNLYILEDEAFQCMSALEHEAFVCNSIEELNQLLDTAYYRRMRIKDTVKLNAQAIIEDARIALRDPERRTFFLGVLKTYKGLADNVTKRLAARTFSDRVLTEAREFVARRPNTEAIQALLTPDRYRELTLFDILYLQSIEKIPIIIPLDTAMDVIGLAYELFNTIYRGKVNIILTQDYIPYDRAYIHNVFVSRLTRGEAVDAWTKGDRYLVSGALSLYLKELLRLALVR